jgi:hypothetical protein
MNGKVQWEFHNENVLDSPIGITTDKNNNIYVVGGGSYNVVVISRDGQNYKVDSVEHILLLVRWSFLSDLYVLVLCPWHNKSGIHHCMLYHTLLIWC